MSWPPSYRPSAGTLYLFCRQGSKIVTLVHSDSTCSAGYVKAMTAGIQYGLTPTLSLWGGAGTAMAWLDSPPCSTATACNSAATVTYSHWAVTSIRTTTLTASSTLTVSGGALDFAALTRNPGALATLGFTMRCDIAAALGVPASKVMLQSIGPAAGSGSTMAPIPAASVSLALNRADLICPYSVSAPSVAGAMAAYYVSARRMADTNASAAGMVAGLSFDVSAELQATDDAPDAVLALETAMVNGTSGANVSSWVFAEAFGISRAQVAVQASAETAVAPAPAAPVVPDNDATPAAALSAGAIGGIAAAGVVVLSVIAAVGARAACRPKMQQQASSRGKLQGSGLSQGATGWEAVGPAAGMDGDWQRLQRPSSRQLIAKTSGSGIALVTTINPISAPPAHRRSLTPADAAISTEVTKRGSAVAGRRGFVASPVPRSLHKVNTLPL